MLKELDAQNQVAEIAMWLAKANAVLVFILILWWSLSTDTTAAFLGGVNFSDLIFQWHPILMTLGMFSMFTFAVLSFRSPAGATDNKMARKSQHAWLFGLSVVCILLGMTAVVKDNNEEGWANLFSLHSMIGLGAMAIYGSNFLLGLVYFYLPVPVKQRNRYKPLHITIGIASFCAAVLAIETGIMELNVWLECNYYTLTPDNDPAKNYHLLPAGCQLSNGIGVLVMLGAMLTLFGLFTWQPLLAVEDAVAAERVDYALPTYSMREISLHCGTKSAAGDVWIVVQSKVYNVTDFMKQHPGGSSAIAMSAGTDATEDFEAVHSQTAWKLLEQFYIGNIDRSHEKDEDHNDAEAASFGSDTITNNSNSSTSNSAVLVGLNPRKRIKFPLLQREQLSSDTLRLRFALQSPQHRLGLPVGQHMYFFAKIDGKTIMRAYTPVSSDCDIGYFELVIKVYKPTAQYPAGGLMSQYMHSLQVGESIEVQGPVGDVVYDGPSRLLLDGVLQTTPLVRRFVMLCGGTGITPMFQLLQAVLRCSAQQDPTQLLLIYSNRTEEDILLKTELDALVLQHPQRLEVKYFLSRPVDAVRWRAVGGYVGRLCYSDIQQLLPRGGADTGNFAMLCGPPGLLDDVCKPSLLAHGYAEEHIVYF